MAHRLVGILILLCGFATVARADVITLKHGGELQGDVVRADEKKVAIRMRFGLVTIDRADIVSIVEAPTPEQEYAARAARIAPEDAAAHCELAAWAGAHELPREALDQYLAAATADPANRDAFAALAARDWHLANGTWLAPDDYYPSIGWVRWDGRWVHPLERAWLHARQELAEAEGEAVRARGHFATAREARDRAGRAMEEADRGLAGVSERIAAADRALAQDQAEAAIAGRHYDEARFNVQRAQSVYDVERIRLARGEPNLADAALLDLRRALRALAGAECAAADADRRVAAAQANLAAARQAEADGARALQSGLAQARGDEEQVRAAEAELAAAQGVVELRKRAVEQARSRFEESRNGRPGGS